MKKAGMLKAKPGQTLYGHLADCLRILKRAREDRTWEYAIDRLGFDSRLCSALLSLLIYTHDLGKATKRWQRYLETGKGRITHALFSALMLKEIMGPAISRAPEGMAALLAVLAHHSMLYDGAYTGESITGLGKQTIPREDINEILQRFQGGSEFNFQFLSSESFTGAAGAKLVSTLRRSVLEMNPLERLRFKGLCSLFLSALQLCDNEASYQYEQAPKPGDSELLGSLIKDNTPLRYVTSPQRAFSSFRRSHAGLFPNDIQKAVVQSKNPFIILQAGCGKGKTAAALHYITSLAEKGRVDRGIITLPTRFTTNSMFWDFHWHYGLSPEHTGIYHGEMESVLLSAAEGEDPEADRHVKDLKFENSFFNRPVNVCTVDHLLYSLLHCHRYADRAFGNLITSAVVFDEIHYYDAYTLSKIGQCMQILRQLRVPHMIMSATIPQSVVNHLNEEAGLDGVEYDFIRQNDICADDEDKPFQIVKMSESMTGNGGVSEKLLSLLEENLPLRQMVVVNQVERAKAVARAVARRWPGINVICYHSEFSRRDRDEKERIIRALFRPAGERSDKERELLFSSGFNNNEQVILVSTQICEMSLDISADVMYSEIAPADAVAQRGGRLHRRGRSWEAGDCGCDRCRRLPESYKYRMYLFLLDWDDMKSHLPYKDDRHAEPLLKRSWDVIGEVYSFSSVAEWVNRLYPESPPLYDDEMREMVLEDAVFGRKPKERFGEEYGDVSAGSFRARHSEVITVIVVPRAFFPAGEFDPAALVKDYGVQVSLNKLRRYSKSWSLREVYKDGIKYTVHVLDLPYSREFGFEF